ncbi:hypothetical protein Anapl_15437 [Anas platyrhynchos]|uniref:Uncharacterized protein n=1 Tax=Anas platyrhynchos TaxID=8839 RepID=R0JVS8_ANAPL|nr:hypothetical protein Anapl_15437 [Anas platyrhynchos]
MGIIHALSLLGLKGALHVIILKSLLFLPLRNYRSNEPRAPLLPDCVTQEIEHVQIRKWPFLAKPAAVPLPPEHPGAEVQLKADHPGLHLPSTYRCGKHHAQLLGPDDDCTTRPNHVASGWRTQKELVRHTGKVGKKTNQADPRCSKVHVNHKNVKRTRYMNPTMEDYECIHIILGVEKQRVKPTEIKEDHPISQYCVHPQDDGILLTASKRIP